MIARLLTMVLLTTSLAACAGRPGGSVPGNPDAPRLGMMPEAVLTTDGVTFLEADTDHDRRTTAAEFSAWSNQQWALISQGADSIARLDFQHWTRVLFGENDISSQFGALSFDRNFDMRITAQEFHVELDRRFALHDRDQNEVVERNELYARPPRPEQMMRPPGMQRPPGGMPPGGPPGGGGPGGGGFPG